jgi:hypothetical protein
MPSAEKATTKHLVHNAYWEVESIPGCCAVVVPHRLRAEYSTKTEADNAAAGKTLSNDFLHDLNRRWGVEWAVPIDIAFAAVLLDLLEDCMYDVEPTFMVADQTGKRPYGDVLLGPFTSRGFIRWLRRTKLATIHKGLTAKGEDGPVGTWTFKLNIKRCRRYVEKKQEELEKLWTERFAREESKVQKGTSYRTARPVMTVEVLPGCDEEEYVEWRTIEISF